MRFFVAIAACNCPDYKRHVAQARGLAKSIEKQIHKWKKQENKVPAHYERSARDRQKKSPVRGRRPLIFFSIGKKLYLSPLSIADLLASLIASSMIKVDNLLRKKAVVVHFQGFSPSFSAHCSSIEINVLMSFKECIVFRLESTSSVSAQIDCASFFQAVIFS